MCSTVISTNSDRYHRSRFCAQTEQQQLQIEKLKNNYDEEIDKLRIQIKDNEKKLDSERSLRETLELEKNKVEKSYEKDMQANQNFENRIRSLNDKLEKQKKELEGPMVPRLDSIVTPLFYWIISLSH